MKLSLLLAFVHFYTLFVSMWKLFPVLYIHVTFPLTFYQALTSITFIIGVFPYYYIKIVTPCHLFSAQRAITVHDYEHGLWNRALWLQILFLAL